MDFFSKNQRRLLKPAGRVTSRPGSTTRIRYVHFNSANEEADNATLTRYISRRDSPSRGCGSYRP